ncbi:hypothetical protein HRK28_10415 [Rathayibacter sp. VKM Ac-2835]|uniref:hypothetical protein n=1 Tax=Rathayibacter sp. VKM Ac-2835 TaxID=2739043 RepID=UPI0015670FCD|nr:hypothetical protein [Rathayibacter sp. VKM Ac-2835]NRG41332.1 hypothetical protein [Rathayibacter sp. VKM Ac-2835]
MIRADRSYAAKMPSHLYTSDLAFELNIPWRDASSLLQDHFGVSEDRAQGWSFTQAGLRAFRKDHPAPPVSSRTFDLQVGREILRRSLLIALGGTWQSGIAPSQELPEIFVFTNPKQGARFGYDIYEGPQADGSYSYTGHGASGPQVFEDSNKALLNANEDGKTIRFFTVKGVRVRYMGAFKNGSPSFEMKRIPGEDEKMRDGIIFKLEPRKDRDEDILIDVQNGSARSATGLKPWVTPDHSDVVIPRSELAQVEDRVMTRVEFELQVAFAKWLLLKAMPPSSLPLQTGSTRLHPDFFVPATGWIVEAKRSSSRENVRMAIGQVLDYAHLARLEDRTVVPVVLLPDDPAEDLQRLLASLGILLIVRRAEIFEIVEISG